MKGYYEQKSDLKGLKYATIHECNHPLYNACTLYKDGLFGLGVIQQRFNDKMKISWWGPIDPWLANDIYEETGFSDAFIKFGGFPDGGMYPTIEVRKLMYFLGMKPLKKYFWETSANSQKNHLLL